MEHWRFLRCRSQIILTRHHPWSIWLSRRALAVFGRVSRPDHLSVSCRALVTFEKVSRPDHEQCSFHISRRALAIFKKVSKPDAAPPLVNLALAEHWRVLRRCRSISRRALATFEKVSGRTISLSATEHWQLLKRCRGQTMNNLAFTSAAEHWRFLRRCRCQMRHHPWSIWLSRSTGNF